MKINYEYIKENMDDFRYGNVSLSGVSEYGLVFSITLPNVIDFLDFIEEFGIYFYRIDDPKFGQKFINEDTKLYIYDWLTQILNTGNYDDSEDGEAIIGELEFLMNFELLNTFKYALYKYKKKYAADKGKLPYSRLIAEQAAINILEIIEQIRIHSIE